MNNKVLLAIAVTLAVFGAAVKFKKTESSFSDPRPDWQNWKPNGQIPRAPGDAPPQFSPPQSPPASPSGSYQDLVAEAQKSQKKLFIVFGSEGCHWCQKLKTDALPGVQGKLSEYVYGYLEVSSNKDAAKKLNVRSVPAYFVLTPDEKVTKSGVGYKSSDELIKWLDGGKVRIRKKF